MKKGWLIGCGIAAVLGVGLCAGAIVLFVVGIFAATKPVVEASEEFLGLLGQGKIAEAYASTASALRAKQDEASFTAAVKQLGLTEYASVSWHNRSIVNNDGLAEGTVTTKNGSTKPISVRLVNEGKWKVVGVSYGGVELAEIKSPPPPVPAEAELRRMVKEALLDFNQAVKAGDFTALHQKISTRWQQQITPQQLQKLFQDFIDKKVDIGGIKDIDPNFFEPASIDKEGFLVVRGGYSTQPQPVLFTLKYTYEANVWKLVGFQVVM